MRLEQCLNYDLYKKIGNYDLDYKKATSVTYIEGREKSEAIQKQQDLERQAEYARRKEFKAINSKYAKDSGLQNLKQILHQQPLVLVDLTLQKKQNKTSQTFQKLLTGVMNLEKL